MAWFGEDNQSWGAWLAGQDTDTDGDGDIDYADYLAESQDELLNLIASDEDGDGDYFDEELDWLRQETEDAADAGQGAATGAAVGLNLVGAAGLAAAGLGWYLVAGGSLKGLKRLAR